MVTIASKPWLMKSSIAPSWAATSVLDEGLGGLDHLDAPGIADEAVDHRDAVGTLLLLPLEEFGLGAPGLEAFGIGAGPVDDAGPREGQASRQQQSGDRQR
jgi:hypothetical protein